MAGPPWPQLFADRIRRTLPLRRMAIGELVRVGVGVRRSASRSGPEQRKCGSGCATSGLPTARDPGKRESACGGTRTASLLPSSLTRDPGAAFQSWRPWPLARAASSAATRCVGLDRGGDHVGGQFPPVSRSVPPACVGEKHCSAFTSRRSSRAASASHTARYSSRCMASGRVCPAYSASGGQVLTSNSANRPITNSVAVKRGSTRVKRPAIEASTRPQPAAARRPLRCDQRPSRSECRPQPTTTQWPRCAHRPHQDLKGGCRSRTSAWR